MPIKDLSLLHIAAYYDSLDCFKILLEKGFPINMKSDKDYLPLHYACYHKSFDVASFICKSELNNETELNYIPSNTLNSPIYLAVLSRSTNILELLFQSGAKLSGSQEYINRTITCSLQSKDMESFNVLINHIDSVKSIIDKCSLIMKSIIYDVPEAIPILIRKGDDVNYMTKERKNALYLACFHRSEKIVELLLDNGAYANEKGCLGQYPIHWAASTDNINIVKMIISHGGDPTATDDRGRQATFSALCCREKIDEIMKILLDAGCDPNLPDKQTNSTLLCNLIVFDPTEPVLNAIKILLEKGADLNIVVKGGKTIYQTAKLVNKPEILEVIDEFIRNHPK